MGLFSKDANQDAVDQPGVDQDAVDQAGVDQAGGLLTREQILAADDLGFEVVPVPEWGGSVRIRALSGVERDRFEAEISGNGKKLRLDNVRAKLVATCAVDADGQPLFAKADLGALGRKSAAGLNRVFEACQQLSGLTDKDVDELLGE